jgi:glycosyltransferase involved in cell wall biosynthesis
VRIVFFDGDGWDYDAQTPYQEPMGGTESGLCYLSVALAARGHRVALYTGTSKPRVYQGVECCFNRSISREALAGCDAFVLSNGPAEACFDLRGILPPRCRLILWTQHATTERALSELRRPEVRAGWDAIVCVSQWQAAEMRREFGLNSDQVAVLRNAVAPAFMNLFPDADALARAKSAAPVLAYTSTPFRGLRVLLWLFSQVHRYDQRVQLRVYSSMKVYGEDESKDSFSWLYAMSRATPGVEYIGSLAQPMLAESLKSNLILAYPNTFPETSCIAAMEAMAAGLFVVSSDLGALPETTMGMGLLVPPARNEQDIPEFARRYAERLMEALEQIRRDPGSFWAARWEQIRAVTTQCTWPIRAAEWEQFLHDSDS